MSEFITPKPGPNYVCDRGTIPALGQLAIRDEDGEHVGLQCSAQSVLCAGHHNGEVYAVYAVIFLSGCVEPSAKGLGFYMAMEAANARELAASLIETADQIDGGKGKK